MSQAVSAQGSNFFMFENNIQNSTTTTNFLNNVVAVEENENVDNDSEIMGNMFVGTRKGRDIAHLRNKNRNKKDNENNV